jgi:hypothetical protein
MKYKDWCWNKCEIPMDGQGEEGCSSGTLEIRFAAKYPSVKLCVTVSIDLNIQVIDT